MLDAAPSQRAGERSPTSSRPAHPLLSAPGMSHAQPILDTAFETIDLRVSKVRVRRSLLCSDIVDFTRLLARLGDTAALQIVRRHDAIVRECAEAHAGTVLELRGDGFLVSFVRRDDAIACAIAIQRAMAADRASHPDGGVHVRIGVHTGELFAERGRLFGLEVVIPFRLLDHAGAGEILVSGGTGGGAADLAIGTPRELSLKGIPATVRAAPLTWRCDPSVSPMRRSSTHHTVAAAS